MKFPLLLFIVAVEAQNQGGILGNLFGPGGLESVINSANQGGRGWGQQDGPGPGGPGRGGPGPGGRNWNGPGPGGPNWNGPGPGGPNWNGPGPGGNNWNGPRPGGPGRGRGDQPWGGHGGQQQWGGNGGPGLVPGWGNQQRGQQGGLGGMIADIVTTVTSSDVLTDLRRANQFGGPPPDYRRKARRFCRRFPGHPKCRGGRIPEFAGIGDIINNVMREGGKWLPRVPRINIRDPLAGINIDLVNIVKQFRINFGQADPQTTQHIEGVCRSFRCKEQDAATEQLRKTVVTKIFDFERAAFGKDNTDNINLRMDRTHQIKQALLEKANLHNTVTAADDGVFDKDLLLTEKQQNFLLNELGKGGEGSDEPLPGVDDDVPNAAKINRERRASIFFEENLVQKWDISQPIQYTFDDSLEEYDKNDVRGAIAEIEKNSCVKFKFVQNPSGYHIKYLKVDSPTFCGLSYIGRTEPANPVYLSFQCGNARGVALHETLHALGLNHQHLRMDRDQHLTIDWSNINPQHYDYFVVADSKLYTTYGVKYDYGSIMHYNAYTAAVNIAKPTMIPKVSPQSNTSLLGQRNGMSKADIEILKKMYCMPGCDDKNVYCGAWALKDLCKNPNNDRWMSANCKKSCNLCGAAG